MKVPCRDCPVLAICLHKETVKCSLLNKFCRSKNPPDDGVHAATILNCDLIGFSFTTNEITFIRDEDEAKKIIGKGVKIK